ncbi:MAG: hypothetical protein HFG85_00800 [Dorea sp.]|mgnify:CR=1 FL=1|nr:hypothetical protein [Dorea sp.]
MYNEEQYIYHMFQEHFIRNKKENIVLYGTGVHTGKLLDKLKGRQIKGLMDVKRTGEILWGYKVFSYEEVKDIPNVCIVIIARDAVLHTVYRRIEVFSRENNIPVYDVRGNLLTVKNIQIEEEECFLLDSSELLKKIEAADCITFDIFDTLLTRKLLVPQDVFRYIDGINPIQGLVFSKERKRAEESIRDKNNPTIYEIFECLQNNTGISNEERERLLALEIKTEKTILCRREAVCQILEEARACGKKIYLISDMYLTGRILEKILKEYRIEGYDGLFVSCDYSQGKQEGLFQRVREEVKYDGSTRILHIGDSFFSDICAAKEAGYDTFQIYSPREMFERSMYSRFLPEPETLEEELVLGKFVSMAYNNPFGEYKENGKLVFRDMCRIVELLVAPVILKYMCFLLRTVIMNRNDYMIFPSRDGYLLRKLYDRIIETGVLDVKLPESIYFYTSRRAVLTASVYTERDVLNILSIDDTRSMEDMLKVRFGITVGRNEFKMDGKKLSPRLIKRLLRICQEERKNYQEYIMNTGIARYQRPAFADFIAVGTIQSAVEKLAGREMQGIYFWKRKSEEERYEKLYVDSLYQSTGDFDMDANIYRFYYFLENILSSPDPSLISISQEGKPYFYEEKREKKDIELLSRIHESIGNYVGDMIEFLPNILDCRASVRLYDGILGLLSKECSEFKEEELFHMNNIDEFMGRSVTSMNR